ncbi:galactofuranosyltransferase, partial [Pediococcus parvulus]|uniref:galactofuranosyltransferase n=1 Tax=Pediococcus parvulus TaxID=54062 RepID=UPI0021A8DB08
VVTKYHKGRHSLFLYNSEIFYAFTQDILRSLDKLLQRKVKIIGIIHDVQSLRCSNGNREFINNELSILKKFDGLIVHSVPMMNWLKSNGIISPMVVLGPFDYLNCQPMLDVFSYEKSIVYAGNLLKASFLTNLNIRTKIFVLGPHPSNRYPKNVVYLGEYPSKNITNHLRGSFGLVWDDKGRSTYEEYNKYNCPYKLSMYLSSGLPIIVWKESALASFVRKNNIGLVLSSLTEIDKSLSSISENQYMSMVNNAQVIGNKIRNGEFIMVALKNILRKV